ncbi:hypothetical protein N9B72_00065 [Bacteriovoracaceae bacterium]|nr:hypothetical protein [Bacteriovoracaceae bacterium]
MPAMGRPQSATKSRYSKVTMAPEKSNRLNPNKLNQAQSNKLLGKISGKDVGIGEKVIDTNRKPKSKMGKDEFLKLLTYQLQNQDPMNPMEQDKFTAELAQFSQLEQLSNLNKKFDNVNKSAEMKDKFYAASFLGKQVITRGQSINVKAEKDTSIHFTLDKNAKNVIVRMFDEKGSMVGEMRRENMANGAQHLKWDNNALDGYAVKEGKYAVQVYAWDENASRIPVETNAVGVVESVNFDSGEAVLTVNGKQVSLRDVKSFHVAQKDLSLHNSNTKNLRAKGVPMKSALNSFKEKQAEGRSIYD